MNLMLYIFGNVANHSTREPNCCLLGIKYLSCSRKKALWCCFESFDNVVQTILINSGVWTVIFSPSLLLLAPNRGSGTVIKLRHLHEGGEASLALKSSLATAWWIWTIMGIPKTWIILISNLKTSIDLNQVDNYC